jgi:hypothetical protein
MQRANSQKPITSILQSPKNQLNKLVVKVNQLRILNQSLSAILESKLAKHCQIANFENGALTIVADNSSWAARIRYMAPDLMKKLRPRPEFSELKSIRSIIQLNHIKATKKAPRQKPSLSSNSADLIQSIAQEMENKELKDALLRLVKSRSDS